MKDLRANSSHNLFSELSSLITTREGSDLNDKLLGCVLLKKYFLDDRAEEKNLQ
jgi:hypothetical protein